MLRIRLSRTGKKRQPSYRVVVAEKESKRDGRVVERIGHYNPLPNPAEYRIEEDRALYWLSVGAQPSDAVRILLEKQGTLGRLTRFHAGESLDTLVTEYQGVAPQAAAPQAAEATAKPAVEPVVAEVEAEAEAEAPSIVEEVAETEDNVAEAVVAPAAVVATAPVVAEIEAEAPSMVEQVAETEDNVAEAVVTPVAVVGEEVEDAIEAVLATDEEE